jgi:hypothetical protein
MAVRPIFVPSRQSGLMVQTHHVEFLWHAGMAKSQSQKSIDELHSKARQTLGIEKVLEISSKSRDELGVSLSAFNLMITTRRHERTFSMECAYQASKVFELGGPFLDILEMRSIDAKRDPRLQEHGQLRSFRFYGVEWPLLPRTAFYDWLYVNALHKQQDLAQQVLKFRAFSDIAFNPDRSINCQAYSAALYVSFHERGLLIPEVLGDRDSYLAAVAGLPVSNAHEDSAMRPSLLP